jgi:hypothetical protein
VQGTWGLPLSSESSSSHPIQLVRFRHKIKNKENRKQISSLKILLRFLLFSKPNAACHAAFIRIPDLSVELKKKDVAHISGQALYCRTIFCW